MLVGIISHAVCAKHDMGAGHPESPRRLAAIDDALRAAGLHERLRHFDAPEATRAQLERVHDPRYVETLFSETPETGMAFIDPDTSMNPHTLAAALRAAGAVVDGVDRVMAGEVGAMFCNVRPPGHHAEHDRAMGFCFFNNVAVGAAHALAAHGLQRVAIVDFDVHHGNGTEDIFTREPRVLLCSSFQHPYYPFRGADTRSDHIINVPLRAGTDGAAFRRAISESWQPALEIFAPQLVMISAGFDGHRDDPLASLQLSEDDYGWVTALARDVADRFAQGRIVSVLEGGYDLAALGRSAAAHVGALLS